MGSTARFAAQGAIGALFFASFCGTAHAQSSTEPDRIKDLSIEELSGIEITSVSRRTQSLKEAPAAVFVISADDIERSGVRSIPGALRLAPNLQVARIDAASYGITARGFNQSSGTANKLLVLMDGRIIYTPLYSGVFWDQQNPIMEDLDRIEVVSGPGGTLWGSNAVNGVINIVSRDAHETTGFLATGGASDTASSLGLRYGERVGESAAFRVYASGLRRGSGSPSEWQNIQGGFRADWSESSDAVTLQGDVYKGGQDRLAGQFSDTSIDGYNVLGHWSRRYNDDSSLEVRAYFDRAVRQVSSGIDAEVDSRSIEAQYNFSPLSRHNVVVGGGARSTSDSLTPGPGTAFLDPDDRTLRTYNLFAQDTIGVSSTIDLILGIKAEHNSYTGMEYMPSARIAWGPSPSQLVWAAASRAVRTPSRFDRDLNAAGILTGGDFYSESLNAYELGYRAQPTERFWFSASAYYNDYDDLRTLEATGPTIYPLQVRNGMYGETYGIDVWGAYAVTNWWRLNAGLSLLKKDLKIRSGSTDVGGIDFAGNDPEAQATLRSLIDIGRRMELDTAVRAVGELPNPKVPSYVAVDIRLGYRLSEHLELSVSGSNLFDDHVEFINPSLQPRESVRSFFFSARWRQ